MTERLYYTDSYLVEFNARVLDRAPDGLTLYLDRSAFYPTSGGQPNDMGQIGQSRVVDVRDEGDRVAHILAAPVDGDAAITGQIDWGRRYDHMQQHTGQHLLSAVFHDRWGFETASVHFGAGSATLDLAVESIPAHVIIEAEAIANRAVCENRAVAVSFEQARTAQGLRKPSDREGMLRIVSIEGIDRSACGGTHVRATGEIGPILLRRVERTKKVTRVEFVCGARAVARSRSEYVIVSDLAARASCGVDELPNVMRAQVEALKTSEQQRRRLEEALATYQAAELVSGAAVDDAGVRWVVDRRLGDTIEARRPLALATAALAKAVYVGIFPSSHGVLLAASPDSGIDVGGALKVGLAAVGGKGGGSPRLAQGTAPNDDAVIRLLRSLHVPHPALSALSRS